MVLHGVAKSEEYIRSRVSPGVPTLRFLANTHVDQADFGYDVRKYELRWGGDYQREEPYVSSLDGDKVCFGLLNECAGYVGWWRFNEPVMERAIDSSTAQRHGTVFGTYGWRAGVEGLALDLSNYSSYIEVPHDSGLTLTEYTLEAAGRLNGQSEQTLVAKGTYGDSYVTNYELGAKQKDVVTIFEYGPNSTNFTAAAADAVELGSWAAYAAAAADETSATSGPIAWRIAPASSG